MELDCHPKDLEPAWEKQTLRTAVPCRNHADYYWHRCGRVVSLGELFLILGTWLTAATIYQYYRTLRLVALKKAKDSKRPGTASGTGVSGGPMQASAIAKTLLHPPTNADLLVDEYFAAIEGLDFPTGTKKEIRRTAAMFAQKLPQRTQLGVGHPQVQAPHVVIQIPGRL